MAETTRSLLFAPRTGQVALRWLLFAILALFALLYLMPLFVMITTSLKGLEEIRTGSLVALPVRVTFESLGHGLV